MELTANINEHGAAVLTVKTVSSTSSLEVPDAEGLADDIEATLGSGQVDAFRDAYSVLIETTGCLVKVGTAGIPIPWQQITSVVAQLRA